MPVDDLQPDPVTAGPDAPGDPEAIPAHPEALPPTNPIEWVRQNRAKAEIIGIGIVSIALIFCMMILVAVGLWRSAGMR